MKRLVAFAAVALAGLGYTAPARACFDGFSVASEQVGATMWTDGTWRLQEARVMARWTARLDALLPPGAKMQIENLWAADVCLDDEDCRSVAVVDDYTEPVTRGTLDQKMARVFDRTAKTLGVSPREAARARAAKSTLYVVQIGSFRSAGAAAGLAEAINMDAQMGRPRWEHHSFYSAGGYPAIHDHVAVHATDVNGQRFHRVVAGVFVDAAQAQLQQRRLAEAGFGSSLAVEHL